jgi:acetyltransferase-like isoleucine patch superfamily enzyme
MIGESVLALYGLARRASDKAFSILIAGAFEDFGSGSVLSLPVRLGGASRITIGDSVFVGSGSWLQTHLDFSGSRGAIVLGDRVSIAGACVISAAREIVLEEDVLLARNVYIADHGHEYRHVALPVKDQGLRDLGPVRIRAGAWLGQNVVVCPGVTIGKRSVVGANSVVKDDVPDYAIAVGAPARVVRTLDRID